MTVRAEVTWQPGEPMPTFANRVTMAAIVSAERFQVSPRSLEAWIIPKSRPNGTVIYRVSDVLKEADRRIRQTSQK